MPKYFGYVFTAYGIFILAVGGYVLALALRTRAARRALRRLRERSPGSA
ncbi:MAG TPA: heme exporter protein CcmD [bacterium]|nr:heme exporter protein CcmD [bacterium]